MNSKTMLSAMIIAMVAMIGLSAAYVPYHGTGTAMEYTMNYDATGDGSLSISTFSNAGTDQYGAVWTNANMNGYQNGEANTWNQMDISRRTTITGTENGLPASGIITGLTTDDSDSTIGVVAAYYDDDAYGSYVTLDQSIIVRNYGRYEFMCTSVDIDGFGYGLNNPAATAPPGNVFGAVTATTGGQRNVTTQIYAIADNGAFNLDVTAHVSDNRRGTETANLNYELLAVNQGEMGWLIDIDGQSGGNAVMVYGPGSVVDVDGTLYGTLYRYGGHHWGCPP